MWGVPCRNRKDSWEAALLKSPPQDEWWLPEVNPWSSLYNSQGAPLKSPLSPVRAYIPWGRSLWVLWAAVLPPRRNISFNSQHTATESFCSHSYPTNTPSPVSLQDDYNLFLWKTKVWLLLPSPVTGWHVKWQLIPRVLGRSSQMFRVYHVPSTTTLIN